MAENKQKLERRKFVPYDWNGIDYGSTVQHHYDGKSMDKLKTFFGQTTGALLAVIAFSIVFIKFCVLLTGKPILLLLTDTSIDLMTKIKLSSLWITTNYGNILWPFVCGILVTIFTWTMVYLDSDVPGVNPPSPTMSPRKYRYRNHREKTCHLSYLMALASGSVVFFLLYFANIQN